METWRSTERVSRKGVWVAVLTLAAVASLGLSGLASAQLVAVNIGPNLDISNEPGPQFETTIAINPNNPSQIVAGSIDDAVAGLVRAYFSSDGGATWGTTALPVPPPITNGVAENAFDPGVAWDTQGNVYFSHAVWWLNPHDPKSFVIAAGAVQVDRSSDGGRTWTSTDFGFHNDNAVLVDKDLIAVDTSPSSPFRDNVYVAWDLTGFVPPTGQSSAPSAELTVLFSRSTDHGVTFSAPILPIGHTGQGVSAPYNADPFVGPDGTVYVAYEDAVQSDIAVVASTDGGITFGTPTVIGPAPPRKFVPIPAEPHLFFQPPGLGPLGAFVYPSCGADASGGPNRGTLYCAWMDQTTTNGTDIFVSRSTDHGQTWSQRVRVNDDPLGVANDQFGQWLTVDPTDGSVSLSFYDTRNDPSHLTSDVFLARSTDGGLTFSPNVQVTTAPTNETCPTCGAEFYGDYQGIAAFGGVIHPVWTDRRASVSGLDDEVFTATITINSS